MKKLYLLCTFAMLSMAGASAQTLLSEDFEEYAQGDSSKYYTTFPTGWTVENSTVPTTSDTYHWVVEDYKGTYPSMSGHAWLYCDGPSYDGETKGGFGPRKEKIITPELNLNDTYQLSFDWKAAAYAVLEQKAYTLQLAVIDGNDTTVIFDIQNEKDVRESGVPKDPYGTYIWQNWGINNSKIDLSAYKGKTVKVAFIYNLFTKSGANSLWLDNIKVVKGTAVAAPVAQSSLTKYTFPKMYIGEKHYSEAFTLRNVGKDTLRVTGFEAPEGVMLVGDTASIALAATESANLQLAYKASLTSKTSGNAVIKTNGGDITIPITATKEAVPDGYQLELFESFPPAGWTNTGWGSTGIALEGDASAYAGASFDDAYLVSPRLDLSKSSTPHKLMFTYYNMFSSEDGSTYASNDASVWVSTNGGATWAENDSIWGTVYSDLDTYNKLITVTIDLSKYTSDNVKVRWKMSATPFDQESGASEFSTFLLDDVLLPGVYGADGAPINISYLTPKDSATEVMNKNVTFAWKPAQFADSYKLYVGTSKTNFDVLNGINVGNTTSYTAATLPAGTTLYWKVAGTNNVGEETDAPVWQFTTQSDNTVRTFPWFEGFEHKGNMPLGWYAENVSDYSKWSVNDYGAYDGNYCITASGRATGDTLRLYSPDVEIPQGQYQVSFWWGNDQAVELKKDANNVRTNAFATTDNNADWGTFEIYSDGKWTQLDRISDTSDDRYWLRDAFDLSAYAGKTVQFRWTYGVTNYTRSDALSLDNVEIRSMADNALAFNTNSWYADKVNYNQSCTSDTIALANLGGNDVTIKNVAFTTANFTTSLEPNTVVKAGQSKTFTVTFAAKDAAQGDSTKVNDNLVITLSDNTTASLPVSGIAVAKDILFYGFEGAEAGQVPQGFTGINADNSASEDFYFWDNAKLGLPGYKSFFAVSRKEMPDNGKYVIGDEIGSTVLMSRCNTNGAGDDYLVKSGIGVTANTHVSFDYRSYETVNSVLPAASPKFKVFVSETSATDLSTFHQVGATLDPGLYDESKPWPHADIDLSAYAGKVVYVAIEASYDNSFGGFIDNVEFDHINVETTGINSVSIENGLDNTKPLYNMAGQRVGKDYRGIILQNGRKFIRK